MKFHFNKIKDLAGFAAGNAKEGEEVKVLTRALLTSDDREFYNYSETISGIFLNAHKIPIDSVHQFLVIIHQDLSADLYVNDFSVSIEIKAKRDIKAGEVVTQRDVADIGRIRFPNIEITDSDKVIYCFKVGWRFGLFFDFTFQSNKIEASVEAKKMNIEKMELSIGEIRRYLSFYNVYKSLESEVQFEEIIGDGWFPFVEILAGEYEKLSAVYQNKFDSENRIKIIVDNFDDVRINKIIGKWWKKQLFKDKKTVIESGINSFLQENEAGFIACLHVLYPQIEGIMGFDYFNINGRKPSFRELIDHIKQKGTTRFRSPFSMGFPNEFYNYLEKTVFRSFDLATGEVDLSRHTATHGYANSSDFSKAKALQAILILDQIYFYL